MIFLGIETSCDETAIALVDQDRNILANAVYSQIEEHSTYGGVVPEIAARAHLTKLPALLDKTLSNTSVKLSDLSAVCATAGPGLIGGVLVGLNFGKALAFSLGLPFYGINHLAGHALAVRLTQEVAFPYVLLLVSGGHTQLICVHSSGTFEVLGTTRDDAAGETFDKTAKLLGLSHPGGPAIETLAKQGDHKAYNFPKPFYREQHCDFSFSGLKTAVRKSVLENPNADKASIAASFQHTMAEILFERSATAIQNCRERNISPSAFVISGGVGANSYIRAHLTKLEEKFEISCIFPPMNLCTDNAAMIAWACIEQASASVIAPSYEVKAYPRWPLDQYLRGENK